jgi:hypothetical protein
VVKDEYDFSRGKRGPIVPPQPGKRRITIRLDEEVLDWFFDQCEKAGGGNYQTMINSALREHIQREREPLEGTLRRVLREELARAALDVEDCGASLSKPLRAAGG